MDNNSKTQTNWETIQEALEEAMWERDLARDYLESIEASVETGLGAPSEALLEELQDAHDYYVICAADVEFWRALQPDRKILN
jgi:hypothetical protein